MTNNQLKVCMDNKTLEDLLNKAEIKIRQLEDELRIANTLCPAVWPNRMIMECINNNMPGHQIIADSIFANVTVPVGARLLMCFHPDISHDCCIWCGMQMVPPWGKK